MGMFEYKNNNQTVQSQCHLISSRGVRAILGGISNMSLWRWQNCMEIDFPKPIKIMGRNYWKNDEVSAWVASHGGAA